MPDIYCRKCGTLANPTDLFCRICGTALGTGTVHDSPPSSASAEVRQPDPSKPPVRRAWGTACGVVAGIVLLAVILLAGLGFILSRRQPGGSPAISVEIVGPQTPYPTQPPYATATRYPAPSAYPTSSPYPTTIPYPTTGPLTSSGAAQYPWVSSLGNRSFTNGWCELNVKNQNIYLDSIVILADVDTNAIVKTVYVRANDSLLNESGISTGTYYIYVTMGMDWDGLSGGFMIDPVLIRFKDTVVFSACKNLSFGDQENITITLNVSEGTGSDTIYVPPENFPRLSP
jgi:hypothetical protein